MKYFRIDDSFAVSDRWYLGKPRIVAGHEIDPQLFTQGIKYNGKEPLEIPINQGACHQDFTLGSFDMPVVTTDVANRIQKLAPNAFQRIPVKIIGKKNSFEIINVLTVLKTINEQLSEITWWTKEDNAPHKIGTYAAVGKIVLNKKSIKQHQVFRIKNWEPPLIISEVIKNILEQMKVSGVKFKEIMIV